MKSTALLKNVIRIISKQSKRQPQILQISIKDRFSKAGSQQRNNGVMMGQRIRGLKRVGIYVPGGTAAYPSSVLMNAVPAKIAGVEEIIMCTPPQKDGTPNPNIIAAAKVAGVDRIFLMGGAQAVSCSCIRYRIRNQRLTKS